MRPFLMSSNCRILVDHYPHSEALARAIAGINRHELIGIVRLWFTEGIPFAFTAAPMVYETARQWLARNLQVDVRDITLIGSGRIGYSICTSPKFGKRFGSGSDLDFSVINAVLFNDVVRMFNTWAGDFEADRVSPRNEREKKFWNDNFTRVPGNIDRGFIDPRLVPTRSCYPKIVEIQDLMFRLTKKLEATDGAPRVKHSSVRIYKDWPSFFSQMCLNFSFTIASLVGSNSFSHEPPLRMPTIP